MKTLSPAALNVLVDIIENTPARPVDLNKKGLLELDTLGATARVVFQGDFPRVAANTAGYMLYMQYFGISSTTLEEAIAERHRLAPEYTQNPQRKNLRLL